MMPIPRPGQSNEKLRKSTAVLQKILAWMKNLQSRAEMLVTTTTMIIVAMKTHQVFFDYDL